MNYTYTIYTSAIPADYCNYITNTALAADKENDATIGNKVIDPKIRTGKIRWIRPGQHYRELFLYLNSFAERANREQFGFDICHSCESFQYTEYRAEDQGHYSWHIDCHLDDRTPIKDRKLSMVVQLSPPEDYEGGIFCIDNFAQPKFDLTRWAPQGSIIVFPSYIKHCVTPVTKGVRKSLVTWYMGTPFR